MIATDITSLFAQEISPFVSTLLAEGRIGICQGLPRISNVYSGCSSSRKDASLDRFSIVLPYAGCSITWEILFNSQYPETPPDFIFGLEDAAFTPDVNKLPSLLNWDAENGHSLQRVLDELLEEYRRHHLELMKQHSRLQFEFDSLLKEVELEERDIEVHVTRNGQYRVGPVNFLIKLPVEFSKIPAYLTKDNPGEDSGLLLVTFQTPEGSKVSPQLYLSPRVESVLGGAASMRIPSYPVGGCLIDYVPTVCVLLTDKVEQIVQSYEKRRDYISTFLSIFGRAVVEYDAEAYTHIAFLLEWHDFFFGIALELSQNFPAQCPYLYMQSVYHEDEAGRPYKKDMVHYPYSPRWSPKEMAERLRAYILDNIADFQRESVTEGTL